MRCVAGAGCETAAVFAGAWKNEGVAEAVCCALVLCAAVPAAAAAAAQASAPAGVAAAAPAAAAVALAGVLTAVPHRWCGVLLEPLLAAWCCGGSSCVCA